MNRLYITDLDGTFLNKNAQVSSTTERMINKLIDDGANFTIATARSAGSALPIVEKLNLKLPIILMNGVIVYDPIKEENIHSFALTKETALKVRDIFTKHERHPFMYTLIDDSIAVSFTDLLSAEQRAFYNDRKDADAYHSFEKVDKLDIQSDNVIFFSLSDEKWVVDSIIKDLIDVDGTTYETYLDNYTDKYFLEVFNEHASKGAGIKILKENLDVSEVVAFGDNNNDVSMLTEATLAYAVENAKSNVKEVANSIIGPHDTDSVAKEIHQLFYSNIIV